MRVGDCAIDNSVAVNFSQQNFYSEKSFSYPIPLRDFGWQGVVFRLDYSEEIGGGHFQRCLDLASSLQEKDCQFFIRGNPKKVAELFKRYRFSYEIIPESASFQQQFQLLKCKLQGNWIVVADLSYTQTYSHSEEVVKFLGDLTHTGHRVVLIDGLDANSIHSRSRKLSIHTLLTPYCGRETLSREFHHLHGAEFFMIDQHRVDDYFSFRATRVIPDKAKNILVTMGQSDSNEMTVLVMKAISALPGLMQNDLKVKIITGPHFSGRQIKEISSLRKKNPDCFEVFHNPVNMFEHFFWCDLAITTAGLTKYQLAFSGAPMIILPHHKHAELANYAFSQSGACIMLPKLEDLTVSQVSSAVSKLVSDQIQRKRMSQIGMKLVDGRGNQRIFASILRKS